MARSTNEKPPASTDEPASPPNLFRRIINAEPSPVPAGAMWALYVAGAILVVIASFAFLGSLLWVTGEIGDGWQGRAGGSAVLISAVVLFLVGRWLTSAFHPS